VGSVRSAGSLSAHAHVDQSVECTPRPAASLESMDTGYEAVLSAREVSMGQSMDPKLPLSSESGTISMVPMAFT